jgi:hypothetical protein
MFLLILLCYTIPFDSPIMDNIEYLQIRKLIDTPLIKPYETEWIIPQIDELLINDIDLNALDRKIISFFNPLLIKNEDFSYLFHLNAEHQNLPEFTGTFFDFRLGGNVSDNIRYAQAIRVRRASEIDSFGPKPWRDFQAYLYEGLLKFKIGKIDFDCGRRNFMIGPGDKNSLLLSLDPEGYDGFILFIPARYFEFYNLFSVLNASKDRYISTHHIGINIKKFLKLGFAESILYGHTLEPLYLNPFLPYYLSQWGIDRNDNIMWYFDAQLLLFNSIIYSEFLIDDYRFEEEPYPHKLAYKFGVKSLILKNFLAKINYTFIDKWVYTHKIRINVYEKNGYPLGSPLGNDVDKLSFSVKFINQYGIFPHCAVDYIRKGEGSIFIPYEQEGGDWNPPFPSGIVEKKLEFKFGLNYTLRYNFYIKGAVGKRYWTNYNHVSGDDRDENIFNIALWAVL